MAKLVTGYLALYLTQQTQDCNVPYMLTGAVILLFAFDKITGKITGTKKLNS